MKTYCINNNCPYTTCKKHLGQLKYNQSKNNIQIANYDGMCRKYISWLVDKILEDTNIEKT